MVFRQQCKSLNTNFIFPGLHLQSTGSPFGNTEAGARLRNVSNNSRRHSASSSIITTGKCVPDIKIAFGVSRFNIRARVAATPVPRRQGSKVRRNSNRWAVHTRDATPTKLIKLQEVRWRQGPIHRGVGSVELRSSARTDRRPCNRQYGPTLVGYLSVIQARGRLLIKDYFYIGLADCGVARPGASDAEPDSIYENMQRWRQAYFYKLAHESSGLYRNRIVD